MVTALRQRQTLSASVLADAGFPSVPRKPGLDGMRALAVVAVVVYHLDPRWLPGGFFGVDMFFVVSGYLITSLLVSEFRRMGGISLRNFWLARARRLLPSVVVLMAVVILASCLFARDALSSLRTDTLFSLLYVVNWWLVFHKVSYFAAVGRPPLLLHLWSLAVEEQFYLLWPPALLFLLRRVNLRVILLVTMLGAAGSSLLMGLLFHPGLDPSLAYFGTDTHAQGLLIGCGLALVVPPWAPRSTVSGSARILLDGTVILALASLAVLLATVGQYSRFAYPSGFVLVDLATAILIVLVVHPAARLGRLLSLSGLRWVGTRSYALYLWHWPIIQLTRPDQDISLSGWPLLLVRLALMAMAAELSHRLVELPLKRSERWATWRQRVGAGLVGPLWTGLSSAAMVGVAVLLVVVPSPVSPIASLASGSTPAARVKLSPLRAQQPSTTLPKLSTSSSTTSRGGLGGDAVAGRLVPLLDGGPIPSTTTRTTAPSTTTAPSSTPSSPAPSTTAPATSVTAPTTTTPAAPSAVAAAAVASKEPILAIGDSVMLAAQAGLQAAFGPNITIDAVVGRQVDDGIARLQQYRAAGQLSTFKTVVVDLGTNGPMTPDQFNQLVQVLQGVPNVVFYNTYDPRPWESTTNATLAQEIPQHPGTVEIDWAAAAAGAGVLYPDGIHPTETAGGNTYAALLVSALS